ncbi:unnamed protein product, partial [Rhizoctonia solani]
MRVCSLTWGKCGLGSRMEVYVAKPRFTLSARRRICRVFQNCPSRRQTHSEKSRIVNLAANNNDNLSPGYVVYEDGAPSRVLLIYYIDDNTGAHDATARIQIGGGDGVAVSPLTQVRVKYFSAPSVSFKGNMTWAGQTLGNHFESDGRLQGSEVIETIQCQNNICPIPLKAPSLALVFLTDAALANSSPASSATASFETSVLTRIRHTATVDQE